MGATYTEAQARASANYEKQLGKILVRMPKEEKEKLKMLASQRDLSVNQFIVDCIKEKTDMSTVYHEIFGSRRDVATVHNMQLLYESGYDFQLRLNDETVLLEKDGKLIKVMLMTDANDDFDQEDFANEIVKLVEKYL